MAETKGVTLFRLQTPTLFHEAGIAGQTHGRESINGPCIYASTLRKLAIPKVITLITRRGMPKERLMTGVRL